MKKTKQPSKRAWPRLPLAIPIFVRSRDHNGQDLLEFATALNISAGGALVAVRRSLPADSDITLEVPISPPQASHHLIDGSQKLRARVVRVTHQDGYQLVGLRFATPLVAHSNGSAIGKRKIASAV
jgi:c-di-GMP-binding flagellar brake protein YcgR